MPKKPEITEQDKLVFRKAIGNIKPISQSKVALQKTLPSSNKLLKKKERDNEDTFSMDNYLSDYDKLPAVTGETILEFSRPGIQNKILRNLRNGKYNIEAILDLHGKNVSEARDALLRFLSICQQKGVRHVLIIHGKGRLTQFPILKNKLNNWLREIHQVLAFSSATTRDGRGGSLYVLLKKPSEES